MSFPDVSTDADTAPVQSNGNATNTIILVMNSADRPDTAPFTLRLPYASTVSHVKKKLASPYSDTSPLCSQGNIYAGKLL